jgi:transposase
MNPLTYWEQIIKMPDKANKFDLRLRLIKSVRIIGVKPTARLFDTTPKTVRKWLSRFRQERLTGLNELPRIPHHCPHKTSPALEVKIVVLRKQFPFKGSKRLKREHNLPCSHEAVQRILNQHGLTRRRVKKHKRKRSLREVKKHWKLFGQISVDTKDLKDIPHYWPQMKTLKLPKYQFTAREIRSGLMFLGFANEKSASNACLFAQILCGHLKKCGVDMKHLKVQTDNGSEFIGCFRQDKTRDGFEKVVEGFGSTHKRIPVKAWSYNSDVETVHSTIESEFYDLESFESIRDFHRRVASYQAWYNLVRENSNKDYKTPLQIIKEVGPNIDPAVAKLPPLMLDWLGPDYITKDELLQRGYDVPCYPLFFTDTHKQTSVIGPNIFLPVILG